MSAPIRSGFVSDERLVKECLNGNQDAWAALLEKYRSLIYSIPLKYGLSHDDANDIFQQVCMQILRRLGTIRDFSSLAAWLIKVTRHLCFYWISKERRFEPGDMDTEWGPAPEVPEQMLRELEKEQLVRETMASLKPRCRELLRMLFFENPPVPYATAAKKLGLATGSIGFVRMRCLEKLRRQLEEREFV